MEKSSENFLAESRKMEWLCSTSSVRSRHEDRPAWLKCDREIEMALTESGNDAEVVKQIHKKCMAGKMDP